MTIKPKTIYGKTNKDGTDTIFKEDCGCAKKKGSDFDIDKNTVTMSTPPGMEFNTSYSMPTQQPNSEKMDTSLKHESYFDVNRNGRYDDHEYESYDINTKTFSDKLDELVRDITNLLKQKNKAYGNTALNPTNVFSKLNSTEAICARIDDKLARIKNRGINDKTEDTVNDLIGYLLLLKMSM